MFTRSWAVLSVFLWFVLTGLQPQPGDQARLTAPRGGSALQGSVQIQGKIDLPGFQYAEISFSYAGAQKPSWFLIQQIRQPLPEGPLAAWDTTTIADGIYQLRLQVFLTTGAPVEYLVSGLRVRNYTAIETNTPTPVVFPSQPALALSATPQPTLTPSPIPQTSTPRPTPTPLPANPAQIEFSKLGTSGALGVGAVVLFILILLLYQKNQRGAP